MPNYLLPPGAWLSGSALNPPENAFNPPVNNHGAAQMPQPPVNAFNPPANSQSAAQMPQPPLGAQPAGPYRAGQGLEPVWMDAFGQQALLGQALRKTRTRIVRPEDPRAAPAGKARLKAGDDREPLWRWQPEFRIRAVEAELLGRLVVQELTLWWVAPPAAGGAACATQPLYTLAPPSPGFDYSVQIDKVLRAATEREDRMPEIVTQASDIGVFFDAVTGIDRGNAPRLAELLELLMRVTTTLVMALKHRVAEFRPVQRSAQVQPVIQTPGHGSLPSGHATAATLTAAVLSSLLYAADAERRMQLERLARRIAFNRVVAGVHFPMDSAAGHALGCHLAAVFIAAASAADLPKAVVCAISKVSELKEAASAAEMQAVRAAPSFAPRKANGPAARAPLLALMFEAAAREVALLRV